MTKRGQTKIFHLSKTAWLSLLRVLSLSIENCGLCIPVSERERVSEGKRDEGDFERKERERVCVRGLRRPRPVGERERESEANLVVRRFFAPAIKVSFAF